jgi:hypothetical protein
MHSRTWARTGGAVQWKIGTQIDIDGLQGPERTLDPGQALVGADRCGITERLPRLVAAHDVDAVQRLRGDRRVLAME